MCRSGSTAVQQHDLHRLIMHPKFEVLCIDRIKQTITPVASVLQDPKFDKEAIS